MYFKKIRLEKKTPPPGKPEQKEKKGFLLKDITAEVDQLLQPYRISHLLVEQGDGYTRIFQVLSWSSDPTATCRLPEGYDVKNPLKPVPKYQPMTESDDSLKKNADFENSNASKYHF